MFSRGVYAPRVPAAGGDQLNSRAGTGLMCLSSTPVPPTAAKAGNLTIFDFVAIDIGRLRRLVKEQCGTFRIVALAATCAARARRVRSVPLRRVKRCRVGAKRFC